MTPGRLDVELVQWMQEHSPPTEIERGASGKARAQTRHDKTAATKLPGTGFRTLHYRFKQLNIE